MSQDPDDPGTQDAFAGRTSRETQGDTKVCSQCAKPFVADDGRQKRCRDCRPERWRGFRVYESELLPVLAALAEYLDKLHDRMEPPGQEDGMSPDRREFNTLFRMRERLREYLMWKSKRPGNAEPPPSLSRFVPPEG